MNTTFADPIAAVVSYLAADSDINALAEGRVYGEELPKRKTGDMPVKAIVVAYSGGGSIGEGARSNVPITTARVDVRSYGETPRDRPTGAQRGLLGDDAYEAQ